jgi:hypothetical protein
MNEQIPQKVPMDTADDPIWYLVRLGSSDFTVQYTGPNPDTVFPVDITGSSSIALLMKDDELMTIVENLHNKLQPSAIANDDNKPPSSVSSDGLGPADIELSTDLVEAIGVDFREWEHNLIRKVLCVTLDASSRSTKY